MKRISIITILLFSTIYSFAQISFTAKSEKVVELGETFELTFSINENASGFRAPAIKNFRVISGPNTSTSQSFQYVNGKSTQSINTSYSYYLRAEKAGTFTIPSAQATVNGKTYKSNSVTIEVIKGNKPANEIQTSSTADSDLFVRVNLSKTSVYQGEHIIATIKIYTRVSLVNFEDMKFPTFDGFWSKEIPTPSRITLNREKVGDKIYNVGVIKKTILIPQKAGKIVIDPFKMELYVQEKVGKGRDFFGRIVDRYDNVKKTLRSAKRTVNVMALPGNQPDNFSGLVGTGIKFNANIDKHELKTDEGINLKIKISGNGNLHLLDNLNIKFPSALEVYEPKIQEQIKNTAGGSFGYKTYEYFLLARRPGQYSIPPIELSYFDLETKSYKTLMSDEFNIDIEKGEGYVEIPENNGDNSTESIETLSKDIKFIKQNDYHLHKKGESFIQNIWFYLSYIIGLLIFFLLIFLRRKQIRENADIAKLRNKKANKVSKKRLKNAYIYMKQDNKGLFYKEILQALWGYIGDKLSIPASELTKDKITDILSEKADLQTAEKLKNILDTCEYAQYGQVTESNNPQHIYDDATAIINDLETKL